MWFQHVMPLRPPKPDRRAHCGRSTLLRAIVLTFVGWIVFVTWNRPDGAFLATLLAKAAYPGSTSLTMYANEQERLDGECASRKAVA